MKLGALLLIFFFTIPAVAADVQVDALQKTVLAMRGKPPEFGGPRGATAQLTVAKHQLRDWVESRLTTFRESENESEFARTLNIELREAELFCGQSSGTGNDCPDWSDLGYLNMLKIRRAMGFLVLQTGVGIECGYDESAYLYSWSGAGWKRVWQSEQNDYTKDSYSPQTIHAVLISPNRRVEDKLVLTLGSESWCMSSLHNVYYRIYRLESGSSARLLLEGSEWARVDDDPPIHGSLGAQDVLIEFTPADPEIMRQAIRHFKVDHDAVIRADPLALSPIGFVQEWLSLDWAVAAGWLESTDYGLALEAKKVHDSIDVISMYYPPMHCPPKPDVWQVRVDFAESGATQKVEPRAMYFFVRWRPPYQFALAMVSDQPSPECTEEDQHAEDEHRTLFPPQ